MTDQKVVHSSSAPAAVGPYSQARWAGDLLFLSGQIGLDPASGAMAGGGVVGQARQALENLGAVLGAAGLGPEAVVKTTIYLADMADFSAVNQVYAEFFTGVPALPARACVAVAGLPKDALVEVAAVAQG